MLPRTYTGQYCSIAGTLEVVGDRWTLLVIREAFQGTRRFDDFLANLGLARTVLTDRLNRLVDEQILERVRYQRRPDRYEYRLTQKGLDLFPVIVALLAWGDRYVMGGRPPLVFRHRGCGGEVTDRRVCARCGQEVSPGEVEPRPGPGALKGSRSARREPTHATQAAASPA
jgi:DNA-binding HxlR family transcriptional regulator